MKKIILTLSVAFLSLTSNATISQESKVLMIQDCDDYAYNASVEEVGFFTHIITRGLARAESYNYWLGVCQSHDPSEGELLDPVFL